MKPSGAASIATDYATPRPGGSRQPPPEEVWLRGNVRPVVGVGLTVLGIAASALLGAAAAGAGSAVVWGLAVAAVAALTGVAACARVAAGPRLGCRGDALVVRLSPWRTELVPLAVVECVFPGSQPLDGPVLRHVHMVGDDVARTATRRVSTLVVRFAERAVEWRERPTFGPWGTWHDGHAIVDGRWCEPLSALVVRRVAGRLAEVKRGPAAGEARP